MNKPLQTVERPSSPNKAQPGLTAALGFVPSGFAGRASYPSSRCIAPDSLDTFEPLGMASFELYRGSISGSAVAPLGVVEHLDVVEDIGLGDIACHIDLAADAFALEQLEEALGHGVVVAVAATAHAGHEVVITQDVLPVMPSELTALIRMHSDWLLGPTTSRGHHQRIEHQAGIDAASPADG